METVVSITAAMESFVSRRWNENECQEMVVLDGVFGFIRGPSTLMGWSVCSISRENNVKLICENEASSKAESAFREQHQAKRTQSEEACSTLWVAETRIKPKDEEYFLRCLRLLDVVMVGEMELDRVVTKMIRLITSSSSCAWRIAMVYTLTYYTESLRSGRGGLAVQRRRALKFFGGVCTTVELYPLELTVSCWDHPDYLDWLVRFLKQTKTWELIKKGGFFGGADMSVIDAVYRPLRKIPCLRSRLQAERAEVILYHGYPAYMLEGECEDIDLDDFEQLMRVVFDFAQPSSGSGKVVSLLIGDTVGGHSAHACMFIIFAKAFLDKLKSGLLLTEAEKEIEIARCRLLGQVLNLEDDEFLYRCVLQYLKIQSGSRDVYVAGVAAILQEIRLEDNKSFLSELVKSEDACQELLGHLGDRGRALFPCCSFESTKALDLHEDEERSRLLLEEIDRESEKNARAGNIDESASAAKLMETEFLQSTDSRLTCTVDASAREFAESFGLDLRTNAQEMDTETERNEALAVHESSSFMVDDAVEAEELTSVLQPYEPDGAAKMLECFRAQSENADKYHADVCAETTGAGIVYMEFTTTGISGTDSVEPSKLVQ